MCEYRRVAGENGHFSYAPKRRMWEEESASVKKWGLKDLLGGLKFVMREVDDDIEGADFLEISFGLGSKHYACIQ